MRGKKIDNNINKQAKNNKSPKKAVRIMSNSKYNDHTAPLFKKYNILPYDM